MSKASNDSFIHDIALNTTLQDERELDIRIESGRHLYNACLGECLRQIALIRQSHLWQKAKRLSMKQRDARKELFQKAKKAHGYSEYNLHGFVAQLRKSCWLQYHIDSSTAQKIATRAFAAADAYLRCKKGRPRFRGYNRFHSIEGKNNAAGIRWKEDHLVWNIKGGKSLKIPVRFDLKDKQAVQATALQCSVKYCRLVRKTIRGRKSWHLQLVLEGQALQKRKNKAANDIVGLDIGPSSIAALSSNTAFLEPFCQNLETNEVKIKKLQKKMSRSARLGNPQNFNEDKTIKKGAKSWNRSRRYETLRDAVAEEKRKLAATRKQLHGELANRVLRMGKSVKLEKLSYKTFQRCWGRSIGSRAPGMFVSMLRRKAENAGGTVEEFSTYQTRLSQRCLCGLQNKKKLSERWHRCACGIYAQRDLFSAHLARHVHNDCLDTSQAAQAWPAAEPLLERAVSRLEQPANRKACLSSFGLGWRQSWSHAKEGSLPIEAADVVSESREPRRDEQLAFRTP
jgi:putative transposase